MNLRKAVLALSSRSTIHQTRSRRGCRLFSSLVLADRLQGLDRPTVWHEFSPLAAQHQAINLGQGYPEEDPPAFVQNAMHAAVYQRNANQYARSAAHMPLAHVLADDYNSKLQRTDIVAETHIATAVGCTHALYCALMGLIQARDEVILLEPAFDIYSSQVQMAGGKAVYVPLRPSSDASGASDYFQLDLEEFERAITPQTKAFILNTPHNPTGKIFSQTELEGIAEIVRKHPRITVIADEVYEYLVFDKTKEPHVPMASLLWDQTLTLSSAGKTFSCTGWKVGWAVGPPHLVQAVTAVQQWVTFSAPTVNQDAIAQALVQARQPYQGLPSYYDYLADDYHQKQQLLVEALQAAGMTPIVPAGGFFIMADTSAIEFPYPSMEKTPAMPVTPMPRDWALSRWMTQTVGVTAIPPSAFYSPENVPLAQNLLRFAYCKNAETLQEAHRRFAAYFQNQ
ncbi:kynurenine---oxoglutarate transaminase / cysteine-S-conjugate beta-lyase / glutamine---phenylpyruvate transaminase [Fistulifera solaris]|uniref:Kynurenine---oxoglutarate transaminase / cysteine-S-conjugate beta-lyase / glutamine---phenylpyruvate transaminase n=1 Tax=Fistulifera solaris TaxID=1519565 RepID=A0A1Z5JHF1_FISSO|nr:kynurenine---oxoglutarate transaminase / cysteine-S-conjugate beta-lyase / glutamine---phenylpyruvate transaminase [Fistulifera solaris]|eukprot:GAX13433.1 kynurenine---oxoglutarate transaminase / cysteine-S-conjugate beta-lyase / glutamine---phenylpyruvate transaminase [Fistulifera solaris]